MQTAIHDAGLTLEDIDYVNLHGTSTELNDRIETRAVKSCFGKRAGAYTDECDQIDDRAPQGASGAAGISAILFALRGI